MAQANINIRTDADLKRDFERLCQNIGLNVTSAFNVIMKQSVRENRIPVELRGDPAYDEVTTTVPGAVVTKEELLRGKEELDAGLGFAVTMEELKALEDEPSDGPVHRELERRHAELEAKLHEWRAAKGQPHE